jgi:hypothetical protein
MEELIHIEEENKRKHRDYINRRRKEVLPKQSGVINTLNKNLKEKFKVKNFLTDIISRLPVDKPKPEMQDINQILTHLHEKRTNLAKK